MTSSLAAPVLDVPAAAAMMLAQSSTLPMVEKLRYIWPEAVLFITAVLVVLIGLSKSPATRRSCAGVSIIGLAIAGALGLFSPAMPGSPLPALLPFAKTMVAIVGILLILLMHGLADREYEGAVESKLRAFDPIRATRGEFFGFILFSLMGLMLCATADDLIWLFLALELTSLPTYVMVAISTARTKSQEAGVKYFFLGALGAAIFLYGFAMLYGATGTTTLFAPEGEPSIASVLAAQLASGGLSPIAVLGIVLAVVGMSFKIAAVPMHFYTPDVYQGAASPVAAFLGFVPKAAGFFSIILLLAAVGWTSGPTGDALPEPIRIVIWLMAALTMTVGNILALLQHSVKRMLAYSSIAHSGYMLVGVLAGPGRGDAGGSLASNGLGAAMFYLFAYGFMNLGAFAVIACLERKSSDGTFTEADSVDDIRGLARRHPWLGGALALSALSLLGFPPLLGFFGKFYLFTSAISAGEVGLVVLLGLNSAIAAFYYLRLVGLPILESPDDRSDGISITPFRGRLMTAAIAALASIALVLVASPIMRQADRATTGGPESSTTAEQQSSGSDEGEGQAVGMRDEQSR